VCLCVGMYKQRIIFTSMTSCLFSSQFCIKHVKLGGQTGEVARSIPVTTTNSLRSLVQTVKFCVAEHT